MLGRNDDADVQERVKYFNKLRVEKGAELDKAMETASKGKNGKFR